jgi:TP901 family phage tail tape measure protein
MADLNANINVGIETTQALNQLKSLQKQISQFHQSVAKSSATAATAQRDLQRNFLNSINAIQGFSAELKTVRTTAESFTNSLEKNKFSIREYFRFAAGATKTFGKNFAAEFSTIEKTAIERVKTLQTQYIKMGRDASGAMQAIAVRPTVLDMKDLGTQTAIAAQKQVIFNQLIKQGSTNLLNFGKNTQWAGRQLMVGFTLPLATLGMTAGRVFFDMEQAALKFRKVYGDLFTPAAEREQALKDIVQLGEAFTAYGISVAESLDIAADAAAAGFAGLDLQNQTAAALKLSVLGQLDMQKALETTISLQNAFQLSSASLAGEIDFLNAVENQTVVALSDITEAVPRVAPVIQQLGGDVRDLAFFLAAMKEGGINAAQGANALKSGLASLINPTEKAAQMLAGVGINIKGIISANQGDIAGIVFSFAQALDKLDPLRRAQAIEQLFGKFQFARISALFDNITREGTQAQRVLELAGTSAQDLADLSESELGVQAASSMNKFRKAVEGLKVALAPIGELFVQIATPFVEFGTNLLKAFNNLPDAVQKGIGTAITVIGGLGPVALMTFGLINNGIANMIKFFATVRLGYLKITGQAQGIGDETQYMTTEQMEAAAAAASLDQAHSNLIQRFTAEKIAVDKLRDAYSQAVAAGARFASLNPGMMLSGKFGPGTQKFASGGFVGGSGNRDTVPAMLTPGEFVIKKDQAKVFLPLLEAINSGKIPGFQNGGLVGGNDKLVRMFAEFGLRLQPGSENMAKKAGMTESFEQILAPLAMRIGEARGITPSQAQVKAGSFDAIGKDFESLTAQFTEKLNAEFETTFADIKDSNERYRKSWQSAGRSVEEQVNQIKSDVDRGVVRKTFGLDEDFFGTIPTMPRREGGTNLERARKGAFDFRQTGIRSYNTAGMRGGSRAFFERRTGGSAKDMQMGHVLDPVMSSMQEIVNDPRATNAAKKAGEFIGIKVTQNASQGIKESTRQASPSKEAKNAGKNIGIGAIDGIRQSTDDAKAAGQQIGTAVVTGATGTARGPRRATTDPIIAAALAQASMPAGTQTARGPRRARSDGRALRSPGEQGFIGPLMQSDGPIGKTKQGLELFTDRLSKASLGISAVSGILTVFGGEISAVSGAIFGLSSAMFALIEITSLLSKTKIGEMAASRAATVAQGMGGTVSTLLGSGGFLTRIANGFKFVLRFLGPVGIGLSALAVAMPFVISLYEEQKRKMEAFGNIIGVTADQIKFLGEQSQTAVTTTSGFDTAAFGGSAELGTEAAAENEKNEQFLEQFKTQIDAAKSGAVSSVNEALRVLAFRLSSSGLPEDVVSATIAGIIRASKRTDLEFDFNSVGISESNFNRLLGDIKTRVQNINKAQANAPTTGGFQSATINVPGTKQVTQQTQQEIEDLGSVAAGSMQGIATQLAGQKITIDEYRKSFDELKLSLLEVDESAQDAAINSAIDKIFPENKDLADGIKGVDDLNKKMLLLQLAGVGPANAEMQKFIDMATDGKVSTGAFTNAIKLQTNAQQNLNVETKAGAVITEQAAEANAIRDKIGVYKDLKAAGVDAALAYKIAGDAALTEGYKTALAAGSLNEWIAGVQELDKLTAKFEGMDPTRTAGGSSPIQDAIENLKKQRQEVLNTSRAYAELRKMGLSAAEAFKFAQNPDLLSAMNAGVKAGSRQWAELVRRIEAAERATRKWQNTTVQGKTEAFMDVYNKVADLFSVEEQVLRAAFEATTRADNQLIKSLEDKIESFNRQLQEYSADLDGISEKEDEINKAYDNKVKALEQTKRLNDDILRQQKSQLSIADALSQGDVAGAASAIQDLRAQNAASALQAQGDQLQLAREAQIASLKTPDGLTRAQVEEKIKQVKKEIAIIETGALQQARDRVKIAQDELDKNIESKKVAGLTRAEWEKQKLAIDQAKARAEIYDGEVKKALKNVQGIVAEWGKLNTTIVTKNRIEQEVVSSGGNFGSPANTQNKNTFNAAAARNAAAGKAKQELLARTIRNINVTRRASGGMIKRFAFGGMAMGSDTVPAMLTPGEFVINRRATNRFKPLLESINNGSMSDLSGLGFNKPVYNMPGKNYSNLGTSGISYATSGPTESSTAIDNSVYNYSLNVNVEGTNATPDQIANVVMRKLQTVGSQRVRGQVVR